MNPHAIYLRNVRTFDEIQLDLPVGLLAIIGQNGAGKSTLISAIDVALFGPEGRSLQPWYPRGGGTDPLTIELVFDHAGELYRVRRSFNPKGRGLSKVEFEHALGESTWEPLTLESQAETQILIDTTIGLSRATFRASSYLAQGDAGAFCDAQPRDRKAILTDVVGLDDWDGWLERARRDKRAGELELAETRALLERADEELGQRDALQVEHATAEEQEQRLRGELQVVTVGVTTAREAYAEVQQQAERRTAAVRVHAAAQSAVNDALNRIRDLQAECETLDVRLAGRPVLAERAGRLEPLQQEQAALQDAISIWEEGLRLAKTAAEFARVAAEQAEKADQFEQAAVHVLAHVGEEHCDRCGQILGADAAERAATSYRADAKTLREEATNARVQFEVLQQTIAGLPAAPPDEARLPALYDEIRQAHDATVQLAGLDVAAERRAAAADELDVMRAELPSREVGAAAALADVEALGPHDVAENDRKRAEVDRLVWAEQELREQLDVIVRQLARLEERRKRLDDVAAELAAAVIRRDKLVADLTVRTAMERACGANGIPALILETVAIPQVEAEASRLLRVLGGPATGVELRTQRETKTGGIADTLDIILTTETGEAAYESFSGGERARIAFALRLALAQLLSGRKGADTGLLVLDEVEGLDAQGIAALVTVLEELQRTVPRIILVSHQAELRDAFPQSLMLENVDGRSQILEAAAV